MNIQNILDRMEDRIFEITKSWAANGTNYKYEELEFDIELLEKDIEQIKELIRRRRMK